jgi:Sulfotransferase family
MRGGSAGTNGGHKRMGSSEEGTLFLVGAPRSGTSLVYKILCLHGDTAWMSNWMGRFPSALALATLNRIPARLPRLRSRVWFGEDSNAYVYGERRSMWRRLFPMPVEGEPLFERCRIPDDLADERSSQTERPHQIAALRAAVATIRRFGGARLFVNKRIANNRRIPLLLDAFPKARFVDIVRDGRAVAYSLSRVDWWADSKLWWHPDTPRGWEEEGGNPWELCARSWVEENRAIERGLDVVPSDQVLRVSYEDFVADPWRALEMLVSFAGLDRDRRWLRQVEELEFPNRNERWRSGLSPADRAVVDNIQAETLARFGYAV